MRSNETKSLSKAKQIYICCRVYASDNGGNYPPSLDVLFPTYLSDRSILVSPIAPGEPVGYKYTPGLTLSSATNTVLIEDKFAPSLKHERIVVYVDDHAEILRIP